jgi:hypothetical protein
LPATGFSTWSSSTTDARGPCAPRTPPQRDPDWVNVARY